MCTICRFQKQIYSASIRVVDYRRLWQGPAFRSHTTHRLIEILSRIDVIIVKSQMRFKAWLCRQVVAGAGLAGLSGLSILLLMQGVPRLFDWHRDDHAGRVAAAGPKFGTAIADVSDFVRNVPASGEVRSFAPTIVYNDCRWHERRIIELVPEGTWVEAGDVLCVLDTRELKEKLQQQELELIRANARLARAEATEAMQDALNERRLASSKYQMDVAENRRLAYEEAEAINELRRLNSELRLNEARFRQGQVDLDQKQFLTALGYASTSAAARAEIQTDRLERDYAQTVGQKNLLEKFLNPRTVVNLRAQAANRQLDYQLTQLDTQYATAFAQAGTMQMRRWKATATVFHDYLTRAIAAATMRAPRAGEVLYCHNREQNRYIEVGSSVYYTQDLIRIVDRSSLMFVGFVSDRLVNLLRVGQPVCVTTSSVPDQSFRGTLDWIGPIPGPISWFEPEVLYHKVQVLLHEDKEKLDLLPLGATSKASITVDDRRDVLQIPISALHSTSAGTEVIVCDKGGFQRRVVSCGATNDITVEINEGLSSGEEVLTGLAAHLHDFAMTVE